MNCALSARWILLVALVAGTTPQAESWPQWRGMNRDGKSGETGLLDQWPEGGPPLLWETDGLGAGYVTPSVDQGRILGTSYRDDDEVAWARSETDGSLIWEVAISPAARDIGYAHGPRSTPTVDGDDLFTLGAGGHLSRLDIRNGSLHWQVDLVKDLGGRMMSRWGYSESVLVDGERVICTPGGDEGTVACLDRRTGDVLWRSRDLTDPAAYSSILEVRLHDTDQYIVYTGESLAGIEPSTGEVLWKVPRRGRTAVIPTPLVRDNLVYVTSGYRIGCNLFEIGKDGDGFTVTEKYANTDLENHHGGAILVGDHVYATSGVMLKCMNLLDGKVLWEERSVGKGALSYADGHLYLRSERGPVALIEANPSKYEEKGRFDQPRRSRRSSWPHPVISGGRLYLRDMDRLFCYRIEP